MPIRNTAFCPLLEFDGDIRKIRHELYNCSASSPTIESKTMRKIKSTDRNIDHQGTTDGEWLCHARPDDATTEAVYNDWYTECLRPTASVTAIRGSSKSSKSGKQVGEKTMGIRKEIEIDGKMVAFKASAAIPRIIRNIIEIYKDLAALEKSIGDGDA